MVVSSVSRSFVTTWGMSDLLWFDAPRNLAASRLLSSFGSRRSRAGSRDRTVFSGVFGQLLTRNYKSMTIDGGALSRSGPRPIRPEVHRRHMERALIVAYLGVLLTLALYGFHRSTLVYLYYRYKKNRPQPKSLFTELPVVTVQLPLFNEMYVAQR